MEKIESVDLFQSELDKAKEEKMMNTSYAKSFEHFEPVITGHYQRKGTDELIEVLRLHEDNAQVVICEHFKCDGDGNAWPSLFELSVQELNDVYEFVGK